MSKPTIAITGASGFIGSQMVTHFSGKGWNVVALVRDPQPKKHKGISYRQYNLSQNPTKETLEGVDYLIHAAYIKNTPEYPNALQQNIDGTKKLLLLSRKNNVKKNILFSSLSAQYNTESTYGQQKRTLEKMFNTKHDAIIRPGLVLGNGGLVRDMAHFMRTKHLVPLVDGGNQPLQVVDIETIILAIEKIIESNLAGAFVIASEKDYSYKEFYRELARAINTRIIFIPITHRLLMYVAKLLQKIGINSGITTDSLLTIKKMHHINTSEDLKNLSLTIPSLVDILNSAVKKGL